MPMMFLHLGPGLAAKFAGWRHFNLTAYVVANLLIDVEPAYKYLIGSDAPSRTLHTWPAGLAFAALAAVIVAASPDTRRTLAAWVRVACSALFGAVVHLILDALYHADVAANLGLLDLHGALGQTLIEIWLGLMILVFGERCYYAQQRDRE